MGRSVGIKFQCHGLASRGKDILESLVLAGWSYNDGGKISYLPIGEDAWDWQRSELGEWAEVLKIVSEKETRGETIGVTLIIDDMRKSGGQFLIMPTERLLVVSITMNRLRIAEAPEITDFTWYLQRLVPPLCEARVVIEYIECAEHA